MKRAALAVLVLGLLATGCDGGPGGTTTTAVPADALDPGAPAGNLAQPEGGYYDVVLDGETWQGRRWQVTAGGPIDVGYLEVEACTGWATRAPAVEYTLTTDGEPWRFSFNPYVPVAPIGGPGWELVGDVPPGLVVIVRGPDGEWACNGDYQGYELSPNIVVEFPAARSGVYDLWVAAPEGASADGEVVILTPKASWPTTTGTTGDETEATPASTFPPAGG